MLEYSSEGRAARARLYGSDPELVLVYVEDEGKENFYDQIMKRLLRDPAVRTKAIGLGGKTPVVEEFEQQRQSNSLDRSFFLIDGDFDELLEHENPSHRHFHQLHRYDIESFLLEEDPFCEIAEDEEYSRTADDYRRAFQLEAWISGVLNAAMRWVACMAVFRELRVKPPSGFSLSLERFVDRSAASAERLPLLDRNLIEAGITEVRSRQTEVSSEEFDERLDRMLQRMGTTEQERERWVSGKQCLLPLALRLLHQHIPRRLNLKSFCFRLAKKCAFQDLAELRNRILAIA